MVLQVPGLAKLFLRGAARVCYSCPVAWGGGGKRGAMDGDGSFFGFIIQLLIIAFFLAVFWKIFEKAGKPGWAAIIPIYNVIVLLEIVGRPLWWIILLFIPIVNVVIGFMLALDLSRSFGHDLAFALGLFFLGFIFYPILAFGGDTYRGPAAAG
jgi:hypothetical protein